MKSIIKIFVFALCVNFFSQYSGAAENTIYVSIPPQAYLVEQIVGNTYQVVSLIPEGFNPVTFDVSPQDLQALSQAKLFLTIGVPYETYWIPKLKKMNPKVLFRKMEMGIEKKPMDAGLNGVDTKGEVEAHKVERFQLNTIYDDHGHQHGVLDPHVWLSPIKAKQLLKNTLKFLIEIDPEKKDIFESNHQKAIEQLNRLEEKIRDRLKPYQGKSLFVYHPSWGYFCDDFGVKQYAIENEGKEPLPKEMAALLKYVSNENITTIYTQPQFSMRSAKNIADMLGLKVASINPLAKSYIENLLQVTESIVNGFE